MLTFGGLEGEPKKEMYNLLPTHLYPGTCNVLPGEGIRDIEEKINRHNIGYPFIVKPEVGGQGILLRKINCPEELIQYHNQMQWEYIVQQMITYPLEVSVFYIRHPKNASGQITGFLKKVPLHVTGDGTHQLHELVTHHPKGNKLRNNLRLKHLPNWHNVLPHGKKYMLSYAANHNRGAQFINLANEIDAQLLTVFDNISNEQNGFYYGRYDIMCESIGQLKEGKGFTILEYNGCGAEPNHFYDNGYTLGAAYKEILKHWKALYEISRYNADKGIKPWPFEQGRKFLTSSRRLTLKMKALDTKMA